MIGMRDETSTERLDEITKEAKKEGGKADEMRQRLRGKNSNA